MTRSALISVVLFSQFSHGFQWENFVPMALQKSPQVEQVRKQYEVTNLSLILAQRNLDWNVTLQTGVERDRRETTSNQVFDLEKSQLSSLNLKKSFFTGTDLTVDALTENIKTRSPLFAGEQNLQNNSYFLTLEQNLWRNAFGSGIRNQLKSAEKDFEVKDLEKRENVENTVLNGGQLFWNAATAERRFKESETVLKLYERMVQTVERKNRNRYTAPGEYAQVQAQYFDRLQQVRINKIAYEQAVSQLKVFLPELSEADLKWNVDPSKIDSVTAAQPDLKITRAFKLADLKKEREDFNADSVKSLNRAQLALVGQVGATGIDASNRTAQKEWEEGRRPSLYMGVKWSHNFGSGSQEAQIRAARAQAQAQAISTELDKQRLTVRAGVLREEVISLYENLKSQEKELQALRRAVQELTRHYNQGRIDISVLIEVLNKAQNAEGDQIEARGNFELKYLEWQFLYDQIDVG